MVTIRRQRRKWVSGIDMSIAGTRYIGMVGPVEPWTDDELRGALRTLARKGPHTRIGLKSNALSHVWDVVAHLDDNVVVPAKEVLEGHLGHAFEELHSDASSRSSFRMMQLGSYIFADIDHGLGDGMLFVDLVHALHETRFDEAKGPVSQPHGELWGDVRDTKWPIPRALIETFVRHPGALAKSVRARSALKGLAQSGLRQPREGGSTRPWIPSVAADVAVSSAATEAAVSAWRKSNAPDVSGAVLAALLARQAFARVGLDIGSDMLMAVNCRRYLPGSATANGNFMVGVNIPATADSRVEDVSSVLSNVLASGYPLLWMAFAASLARVGRAAPGAVASEVPVVPRMEMMYSDLGRPSKFLRAEWIDTSGAMFSGLLDPSGPEAVTVMSGSVRGERSYSVSFHDNVFSREKMTEALLILTRDPMSLLGDWSQTH